MSPGNKLYSPDHAEALQRTQIAQRCWNWVRITIFKNLTCEMSKNATRLHTMQWVNTINDSRRLWPVPAAEAPINAKWWADALPHWLMPTMTYPKIYKLREWIVGGVWVQFRSGDIEHGMTLDASCFSLLLIFRSQTSSNGVGTGFYHLPMEVDYPSAQDPPKGHHWAHWSVVGLDCSYDCVCRMIVSFFVSLFFTSLILSLAAQEVCAYGEG